MTPVETFNLLVQLQREKALYRELAVEAIHMLAANRKKLLQAQAQVAHAREELRRHVATVFLGGRKDVRLLQGVELSCEALEDTGEAYCGFPAVAEVATRGGWRPVCGHHLEGL